MTHATLTALAGAAARATDASTSGFADVWKPVLILFAVLLLMYFGMWRGWRNRGRQHVVAPLVEVPDTTASPLLEAGARYFGTTTSGNWLDRVVARGLGTRSSCRLILSEEGLDVLRPDGAFRVPAGSLRAARHDAGHAGKVVPPHGLLVVTWQHGDLLLDSGFRLTDIAPEASKTTVRGGVTTATHDIWIREISTIAKEHTA